MKISLFQYDIAWENPKLNFDCIESRLSSEGLETDLLILPEMFTTGFTMNTQLAESMEGPAVNWMINLAKKYNLAVAGSVQIKESERVYNRMVWCNPDGVVYTYDKRHLFRIGIENENFSSGSSDIIISYKGWNIKPLICYDLRFPVWTRNINNGYDLLIYFTNWPEARIDVFNILAKARAIENQCYVAAVNRIGLDGNNINYNGNSMVVDYKGKCLLNPLPEEERLESISLSLQDLIDFRAKFPVWKDADKFTIKQD